MSVSTAVALVLALFSTTLTDLAYRRDHAGAGQPPLLPMRRPLQSARVLLTARSWMLGFAMETGGFLLYAAALALASLAGSERRRGRDRRPCLCLGTNRGPPPQPPRAERRARLGRRPRRAGGLAGRRKRRGGQRREG